ncbi:MAG: hypothetical protein OHK0046_30260 [Anaerolineae bacterium]
MMELRWISNNRAMMPSLPPDSGEFMPFPSRSAFVQSANIERHYILVYEEGRKLKFKAVTEQADWPAEYTVTLSYRTPVAFSSIRTTVTFYMDGCMVDPQKLVVVAARIIAFAARQ